VIRLAGRVGTDGLASLMEAGTEGMGVSVVGWGVVIAAAPPARSQGFGGDGIMWGFKG
jgi:hypothetical protein